MSGLDRIERFRQRADLVDLHQDRIGDAHADAVAQARRVGHEQIVTDELAGRTDLVGQRLPAVPVVLGHAVLDREDRVLACEFGEVIGHGFRLERPAFACELVLAVLEEFGRCTVERDMDVVAWLVTGLLDRLHDEIERDRCAFEIRCEAALVAHIGAMTGSREFLLERVEDFSAHADRFSHRIGADRHDHEFLEIDRIVGMRAAIDDVHHRHRQHTRIGAAHIAVEREARRHGGSLCRGERHTEDGVCAELGLVGRAVELDHHLVERDLLVGFVTAECIAKFAVDGIDRLGHALAHVAVAAVAQFNGFVCTGGSARRNRRTADRAIIKMHIHLDGGIAAAVENFAADDIDNDGHSRLLRRVWNVVSLRNAGPESKVARSRWMAPAS